jgi:hypothetical protein
VLASPCCCGWRNTKIPIWAAGPKRRGWQGPAELECPLSRRVSAVERTCRGHRENGVHGHSTDISLREIPQRSNSCPHSVWWHST